MRKSLFTSFLNIGLLLFLLTGCAAAPMVTLIPAAVPAIIAGAGSGISYTFTNIAYKTTVYPMDRVRQANIEALDKMSIKVDWVKERPYWVDIKARTRNLTIYITLYEMTATLTRIEVNAKEFWFLKDKNTAFEIIYQTEVFLAEDEGGGRKTIVPPGLPMPPKGRPQPGNFPPESRPS